MNKGTTAVLVFVAIALVATVLRFTLFGNNASDKELIQGALKESIEASKEGRSGSVIELLSAQFEVNGTQPGRGEISRLVKEYKPQVEVPNDDPVIAGESAEIISPVRLKLQFPLARTFEISDVKFLFQKEQATTFVFFPTKKWRLRSVELPEDAMSQLGDFGGGSGMGLGLGGF